MDPRNHILILAHIVKKCEFLPYFFHLFFYHYFLTACYHASIIERLAVCRICGGADERYSEDIMTLVFIAIDGEDATFCDISLRDYSLIEESFILI